MNILVIGAGYVGLVTATCLASATNRVVCVDTDIRKINMLRAGEIPIYEPGLKERLTSAVADQTLSFAENIRAGLATIGQPDPEHPISNSSATSANQDPLLIFIAVGTPQGEDGSADLRYVLAAASEIGQELNCPAVIINKSTVPVGTGDLVKGQIAWQLFQRKLFIEFDVASNPEFLKEGAALEDFFNPDRVVLGTSSDKTREQLLSLYRPFVKSESQLLCVGIKEAELIKYASNGMLAARISFMNEMATLCDRFEIDVEAVKRGVGSDSRIGPAFLNAGAGYGGSCFPKDVQALIRIAQSVGVEPLMLQGIESRNKKQKHYLYELLMARMGKNLYGRNIAVWGLAFKPGTDDMREASSVNLIRDLCLAGAKVSAHDPVAGEVAQQVFADLIRSGSLVIQDDALEAARNAEALVLVTEWLEYREILPTKIQAVMQGRLVLDGRNALQPEAFKAAGFTYAGIGRR
ncbi:UDP-glucose/GDP-mannose dehydrogenase family protein [Zwartia sp.]|uniref:UDP-glucose dehydrogenase family protein n=1 Tax=Zwartia sp. TaxID=2978004 RepID=UPI002723CBA5|nr:UDP-glucose/GDP-mannose dehydrogenase family protein [Zwartia sp.]MDO9023586.1 UDP-glucose/GDP-mannose dehydrogenase family protein [Zwartia sp.]